MNSRLATAAAWLALILMLGLILHVGRPILIPVMIAILLVFIISGLSKLSAKVPVIGPGLRPGIRRVVAALFVCGIVVATVLLVLSMADLVASRAPALRDAVLSAMARGAALLGYQTEPSWQAMREALLQHINVPGFLTALAGSVASYAGVVFFILLNVGFMLAEERGFNDKLALVTKSPEQLDRIRKIVLDIDERVSTYLALKTLMNCLIGGLSYVILKAFGVELAALWALVIGLLNYIPYFGSAVGVTLPVLLMLVQSPDVMIAVYLAIALALAQVLVGNIIEPMAMGRSLNLSPWVILISIAVWGSLWGIAGAVFSVPITAVLVVVMSEFDTTRPVSILLSKDGEVAPLTA